MKWDTYSMCLDEYATGHSYHSISGVYGTQNLNATDDHPDPGVRVVSIMDDPIDAWDGNHISVAGKSTVGWQDSDGDGIFDVLDVPLDLQGSGDFETIQREYVFTGASAAVPLQSLSPHPYYNTSVTLNTVDRVEYRLDAGSWITAAHYGTESASVSFAIAGLPSGSYSVDIRTADDDTGVTSNIVSDTFVVPNRTPVADAGGPYFTDEGSGVVVSAVNSSDPDDDIATYEWDLNNDGQFDDATGVTTSLSTTVDGTHPVAVRVTDDDGAFHTATALVTVHNVAPMADAGGPYTTDEGTAVTLDASASTDPGSDIATYEWDLDNDGQFDDATGITATFSSTEDGTYPVAVRVTDDDGAFHTATALVTVNNVAPMADAGGPYTTKVRLPVKLDARLSHDPGNDIVAYAWDLNNDGQFDDSVGTTADFIALTTGEFPVRVRVTDEDGVSNTATSTVTVTELPAARVTDRLLYYGNSSFAGNSAIASDKQALLPGQTATFLNYTSFSRGINTIIIEVDRLHSTELSATSDFLFRIGNTSTTNSWAEAPEPVSLTVRSGVPDNLPDQITIEWNDGEITNSWLQVTILSTIRTGLAESDVFYFGNAPGESGDSPYHTFVNGIDFAGVRDNLSSSADITNRFDYNRDNSVDGADLAVARDQVTNFRTALRLLMTSVASSLNAHAIELESARSNDQVSTGNNTVAKLQLANSVRGVSTIVREDLTEQEAMTPRQDTDLNDIDYTDRLADFEDLLDAIIHPL